MRYLIIAFLFFSCAKDPNTPSGTNASGSIEYKVNGSSQIMNNVDILTGQYVVVYKQLAGSIIPKTRYVLNAQNGVNNMLAFNIESDSLQLKKYRYDYTTTIPYIFSVYANAQQSGIFNTGDYFEIIITSYSSSRVSGTFTAKLTPLTSLGTLGTPGATVITEGKINAVQVVY